MPSYSPFREIIPLLIQKKPFVFLDTALPSAENKFSYLFLDPIRILTTRQYDELPNLLQEIEALSKQYWIAGYLAYEAGYSLEEKLKSGEEISSSPLAWFGVFEAPHIYDHQKCLWQKRFPKPRTWQKDKKEQSPQKITLTSAIDFTEYSRAIKNIKDWIAKGHTYQVNYTFDVLLKSDLDAPDLYMLLRQKQQTPFCAYIQTGAEIILSFSPELFFSRSGNTISVKPMKGTAPRGLWSEEDVRIFNELQHDPKNQSENVMIVDLLRNDLGKICKTGSVLTKKLFELEKHPTLFQMTSTVTGRIKSKITYADIFRNIFPSGSVTGAPKIRTMEIIRSLEKGKRGVYCGAIGFISPYKKSVFNVPIRTLQKAKGQNKWTFRVGSGIVWDSSIKSEWEECKTKCKFLIDPTPPEFEIFESLLWQNGKPTFLDLHIERMKKSSEYFMYPFSKKRLAQTLTEIKKQLKGSTPAKVRILLNKEGFFRWDFDLIAPNDPTKQAMTIFISKELVDEQNVFLYHKTTYRPWYKKAMQSIKDHKCYDVIFTNTKGEITEGARTNIFVQKGKMLYTPPLSCGLLPGVLREHLISQGKCKEKILFLSDLKKADAIFCGNSVRGLQKVFLSR